MCFVPGWRASRCPARHPGTTALVYWRKNKTQQTEWAVSQCQCFPSSNKRFPRLVLTCSAAFGPGCRRPGWCWPEVWRLRPTGSAPSPSSSPSSEVSAAAWVRPAWTGWFPGACRRCARCRLLPVRWGFLQGEALTKLWVRVLVRIVTTDTIQSAQETSFFF